MMIGYKAFNNGLTCRGFKYEIGQTYEMDEKPEACKRGFHFCKSIADTCKYYDMSDDTRICRIEAIGDIDTDDDIKYCTNKIKILEEVSEEWYKKGNSTASSTGYCNTGYCNTGYCNTGNRNTGYCNTGDCNTGYCNTGDWNTGCFNTDEQKIKLFNKQSDWGYRDWWNSDARYLLNNIPKNVVEWIDEKDMTDEEKTGNPTYETTGGYLKVLDESECCQIWWDGLSKEEREVIKNIPNFDNKIFEEITGIKMNKKEI